MRLFFIIYFLGNSVVFSQLQLKKLEDLPKELYETSGLELIGNEYLVSHNDGGNKSELFVLKKSGEFVKTINIKDTPNIDWEDLTQDTLGNLYIGDFGNNENKRRTFQIYKVKKGYIDEKSVGAEKIEFYFTNQLEYPPSPQEMNFDVEAFFWKDGYLYLFTKCRTEPFTGISFIYRVPDHPGSYEISPISKFFVCDAGWRFCSITAADYDPKSGLIALLTYTRLYIVSLHENPLAQIHNCTIVSYALPMIKQREGICFKDYNTLYMTDEHKTGLGGGNLYKISIKTEE